MGNGWKWYGMAQYASICHKASSGITDVSKLAADPEIDDDLWLGGGLPLFREMPTCNRVF